MKITVKLFGSLQKYDPKGLKGHSFEIRLKQGSKVIDVLNTLGIPREVPRIIMVNGKNIRNHNKVLKDTDVIAIFPPMVGG